MHGIRPFVENVQYTDDDTLYTLGKYPASKEMSDSWRQTIAYGDDGTFYQWFNELGQGVLMQYQHNPEGAIDPEIVTVWSWEHIDLIETAVAQWNHTHSSPIFRYETAESQIDTSDQTPEQIAAQEESYMTRLNLELLNGQGPDVMILDGLNVDNMMEFMAPLDQISTGSVYDSLVERFTVNSELLAIPVRMNPYLLGRKAEGTQEIGSLNEFADLITTSTGVLKMNGTNAYRYYEALYNVYSAQQVFQLWYPAWADAIWEDGRLQKDVFMDFLEETNRLVEHYTLNGSDILGGSLEQFTFEHINSVINETEDEMSGNTNSRPFPYTLAATDHVGLFTYWWYENDDGNITDPIPCILDGIPGPDGTGAMVPKVIAGVREGGNEEAGQEFIQLLLSREMQLGMGYYNPTNADGYPVKWSYTEELLQHTEEYMHQQFNPQNDYQATLNGLRAVVIDETLYEAALYAAQCFYREAPDDFLLSYGFNWETITSEEAANMLDALTRIYLAEQAR